MKQVKYIYVEMLEKFFCFGRKSDVTSDPKNLRRQNRQQAGNEAGRQGIKATFSVIFFVSSFERPYHGNPLQPRI